MKRISNIIVLFVLSHALRVFGSEAITSYSYSPTIFGFSVGGAGFAFSPTTGILVTSLGFNGGDLTSTNDYQVSLWNAAGSVLATTTITTSDTLFNQTRYDTISGVALLAGNTYYLQAVGVSSGRWVGDVIFNSGPDVNGTFTVSTDISYLGAALGLDGSGHFPNQVQTASAYLVGANFQYVVPEPSTFCLAGLGLGLFALARRMRGQH